MQDPCQSCAPPEPPPSDDYYLTTGRFDEIADAYAVGVTLLVLLSGSAAVDPVQGHIIGRCDLDDVSEVANEWA